MRAVIQRVSEARVSIDGATTGSIGRGLLVLAGIGIDDTEDDVKEIARKICSLRIFDDAGGRMNIPLSDFNGEVLLVSQFTLYGDCRKGRRPDFTAAAPPDRAKILYESLIRHLHSLNVRLATGIFAASMQVSLVNDGPVTLILDTREEK